MLTHLPRGDQPKTCLSAVPAGRRVQRHTLEQELRSILAVAEAGETAPALPPIRLHTVRTTLGSTWPRGEIYDDEGR